MTGCLARVSVVVITMALVILQNRINAQRIQVLEANILNLTTVQLGNLQSSVNTLITVSNNPYQNCIVNKTVSLRDSLIVMS